MKNGIEIRWHGRGGQGAKTAALLLADVAFKTGQNVQGFPDYVVVVDETLLDSVDVTAGLKETGAIIINTPKKREEMIPKLNGYKGRVYAIDARHISVETLGKNFPNSPMLAATVAVSEVMEKETFIHEMRASYEHKFAKKPEVIDGNMEALERAFDVVSIDIQKDKEAMA